MMSMSDTTDTQRYALKFDPRLTSQTSEKSAKALACTGDMSQILSPRH